MSRRVVPIPGEQRPLLELVGAPPPQPPQLVLGPCDFSRILENSGLALRSAGLGSSLTFQKTYCILFI